MHLIADFPDISTSAPSSHGGTPSSDTPSSTHTLLRHHRNIIAKVYIIVVIIDIFINTPLPPTTSST
jgi:hypothetical protein